MRSSRSSPVVRNRLVRLGTMVKEFQILWSLHIPHQPQHTKNVHDTEIHTGTDRKLE